MIQTAPIPSNCLEIGVRRPHLVQGLEFFFTTALCAAPNPLLLTVVQSLGVVRANFFASGHLVPGTASSKVKKFVRMQPTKMLPKMCWTLDNLMNRLSALSNPGTLGPDFCLIKQKLKILI